MDKILTVSIAAYNMEKYIEDALESLVIPEIMDDIEIFVIDDGGTDGTMEIASRYQERYPQSFVLVHKENGGYGSTVNYSIEHASGKYFKLLDGDDWFDKDGLKKLVESLKKNDSDVVITPMKRGPEESSLINLPAFDFPEGTVVPMQAYTGRRLLGMWVLTYKTDLLRKSGVRLPEKTLYTDQLYSTIPFNSVTTIQFFNFHVYCYRIGRDGQSVSVESRIKHIDETLRVCSYLIKYTATHKNSNNYQYLVFRTAAYYCWALRALLLLPTNRKSLKKLRNFERMTQNLSEDIYIEAIKIGGMGKAIKILRATDYKLYWLFLPVPRKLINLD
ncbi:MAG: glycosyltransferase family 2 protein [Lachnospiraceae bacterium]|nr:glycosyltransferase family 2 protein [Lachnospiraceae bacterium]